MFSLAERLGMTVARLEAEADLDEIHEWMAYFAVKQKLNKVN